MMRRIVLILTFVLFVVGVIQLAITVQLYISPDAVLPAHDEAAVKVAIKQPAKAFTLPQSQFVAQTFNNCGPATLSMILSYYGKNISQEELATQMRPFNNLYGGEDDKSVFAMEFVTYAQGYGFEALHRPNGTTALLQKFIANDIPVIVRTQLNLYEDIGHFRIVRGYDSASQTIVADDSYNGPGLSISESDFLTMWKAFNYGYILIYPKEKKEVVEAVLAREYDENGAYQNVLKRAENELEQNPDDIFAQFNIAIAEYYLGNYEEAVAAFEKAEPGLPPRMLWYQYEPILAYQKLKNYERVIQLTQNVFYSGNLVFSELYQVRGEVFLAQGNKEAARGEFEKAVYYNKNLKPAQLSLQSLQN